MILFTDLNLDKFYLDDFDGLLDFLVENGTITKHDFVTIKFNKGHERHYLYYNNDVIGFYLESSYSKKKIEEHFFTSKINTILQSLNIEEIK